MSEMAVITARRNRLQQRAEAGSAGARKALALSSSPTRFLSTVQIGITLIGILSGALGGATLAKEFGMLIGRVSWLAAYSEAIGVGVVVLLITYFSLVLGELVPKRLAQNNAERLAILLAGPMNRLAHVTGPVVSLLSWSTEAVLRFLRVRPSDEPAVTEEDVRMLISQGARTGVFEASEQEILRRVFRLGDRRVSALMTYRTEVVWLDVEDELEQNLFKAIEAGYSIYPLCRQTIDDVLGVVRVKDLLACRQRQETPSLVEIAHPPVFVPESTTALNLLDKMRRHKVEMALIIDEFGGLLGLVTLKNILDALVGELPSPEDHDDPDVVQRQDGSLLIDGSLQVDELKDLLAVSALPGEEAYGYETLGGMLMAQFGRIPHSGDVLNWGGMSFEVVDMDGRRVDKVLVRRTPSAAE